MKRPGKIERIWEAFTILYAALRNERRMTRQWGLNDSLLADDVNLEERLLETAQLR